MSSEKRRRDAPMAGAAASGRGLFTGYITSHADGPAPPGGAPTVVHLEPLWRVAADGETAAALQREAHAAPAVRASAVVEEVLTVSQSSAVCRATADQYGGPRACCGAASEFRL